jgi:hypothetical protein
MNTPLRASAPAITTPYAPQLRTIPEDSGRQITYQEFVDTINNHMATHNTVIEVHQPPQRVANPQRIQTKGEKIAKLVVILGIIIAVVVLIWIFA